MNRNRLYGLLLPACLAGFAWLIVQHHYEGVGPNSGPNACMFKWLTSFPCPSCGSTRSVLAIFNGDLQGAFLINPIGYVVFTVLMLAPGWITYDLIAKRSSLWNTYLQTETFLKKPIPAIIAICLILLNWIWCYTKHL